jgi:hypothetical protein
MIAPEAAEGETKRVYDRVLKQWGKGWCPVRILRGEVSGQLMESDQASRSIG